MCMALSFPNLSSLCSLAAAILDGIANFCRHLLFNSLKPLVIPPISDHNLEAYTPVSVYGVG
jgi:hypothetical protein